jgi:hypothetical protein
MPDVSKGLVDLSGFDEQPNARQDIRETLRRQETNRIVEVLAIAA